MKLPSLILLLIFTTRSTAQDTLEWAPIGAQWYYHSLDPGLGGGYWLLESIGDTMINDTIARIIRQSVNHPDYSIEGLNRNYYIYSSKGQVYVYNKDHFSLLYDFNTVVGDTIYREALSESGRVTMCFRIDSISTVEFQGKNLKRFHSEALEMCSGNYGTHFSGWVTELLGTELFFFPSIAHVDCDGICPYFLRCYLDGDASYKPFNFACDTLDLLLSAREYFLQERDWYLYPNPIQTGGSNLRISELPGQTETWFYEVRDVSGRLVVAKSPLLEPDLRLDLHPGLYWFIIEGKNSRESRKLVILK